jgi:hypothetical protein
MGTDSRNYKRIMAKRHFKNGDFQHYVSNGDWGYEPSHWYFRKTKNGRKNKDNK